MFSTRGEGAGNVIALDAVTITVTISCVPNIFRSADFHQIP